MGQTRLRLLAWDDPRAIEPLAAAIEAYRTHVPGTSIELERRPLAAFNDEPVEVAARRCDLLVYDHPMVPRAVGAGALLPVDFDEGAPTFDTVGGSGASYDFGGRRWGWAIDAACQVMVSRPDQLAKLDLQPPATLAQLLTLVESHPGRVAIPLYPSDALCTLLTLSALHARAAGAPITWLREDAVAYLLALARRLDAASFDCNPPTLLRALRADDRLILAPFIFGYANVTRPGLAPALRWHDLPSLKRARASILGGAGIGLSAYSTNAAAAREFGAWFAAPPTQRSFVVAAGGQPALREIWDDPAADRRTGGFFTATRTTMDAAVQRPQVPWWPAFHEEAGYRLVELLRKNAGIPAVVGALRDCHDHHAADPPLTMVGGQETRR